MEHIHLFYEKEDVLNEVKKITSYIARARKLEETGDIKSDVILETQDIEIFDTFINNAYSEVFDLLSGYMKCPAGFQYDEDEDNVSELSFNFHLFLPETFNDNSIKSLNTEIRSLFVNKILAEWFFMFLPEDSALYASKAERNMTNIKFKLTNRSFPTRRQSTFP